MNKERLQKLAGLEEQILKTPGRLKDPSAKRILKKVLDLLQDANELGGVDDPNDFIFLMRVIAQEAASQSRTASETLAAGGFKDEEGNPILPRVPGLIKKFSIKI